MGKIWGSTEKVEYKCKTTNLPLCNDTIIVLKVTPLHSVSVITNFVIPKCDKQKSVTLFRLQPARDPRSPPPEEVRPIFAPTSFSLIRSVASPLGATENLRENALPWQNPYNLVVFLPNATKLKT